MPKFPYYKLISIDKLTDDDILLIENMDNPSLTMGLEVGTLKNAFQGSGLTGVSMVNGQTGVVVLTATEISETDNRLWLTADERIKIAQSNTNFVGYYVTASQLQAANPISAAGDYGIVQDSGNTVWTWNPATLSWDDTGAANPTISVVDNLNTQDPISALSANQGYILNNLISQFQLASVTVNQTGHGLSVGTPVTFQGGFQPATNLDPNLGAIGIVVEVQDSSIFTVGFQGRFKLPTYNEDLSTYYLGNMTFTTVRPSPSQYMQRLGASMTGGDFVIDIDALDKNWDEINSDLVIEGTTHLFMTQEQADLVALIPGFEQGNADGSFTITKIAHGWVVGDAITKNSNTGVWEKADRAVWETTAHGIVTTVTDVDNVIVTTLGQVSITHGYDADSGWVYLMASGAYSQTRPPNGLSQELFYPTSATTAFIYIQRPIDLDAGIEGGDLSGYMQKIMYDPNAIGDDVFDMANMIEDTNAKIFTDVERIKLTGIEAFAQVNPDAAAIKVLYESNADTNEFSDAEQTKLAGLFNGANRNLAEQIKFNSELDNVYIYSVYGQLTVDTLAFGFYAVHLTSASIRIRTAGGTWGSSLDVILDIATIITDIGLLSTTTTSITEFEFTATYDVAYSGQASLFMKNLLSTY